MVLDLKTLKIGGGHEEEQRLMAVHLYADYLR
jgi:hypothetical protein